MPSLADVKSFREKMYQASMTLIDRKGADYNRDQQQAGDTLFNLRVCELLGIVPSTEEGILVRLSDKFMRLISLTKPGREAAVKDESVLDTIVDCHNYLDYLGLIWQQRRAEAIRLAPKNGRTISEELRAGQAAIQKQRSDLDLGPERTRASALQSTSREDYALQDEVPGYGHGI